jgi:hypothetical protein
MFYGAYEEMVRFASEGELSAELRQAKAEFVERTGELFESDASFERRLASFLEWYVLDRPVSFADGLTPAQIYINQLGEGRDPQDVERMRCLTKSTLSLFEFRRTKGEHMQITDLLSGAQHEVYERRKATGLEPDDIIEARIIPLEDKLVFAEAFAFVPRAARRAIIKVTKAYRKDGSPLEERLNLLHRVSYYTNRCERYKHVDPKQIFADL